MAARQVRAALDGAGSGLGLQEPQLGTGHAVMQALPHLATPRRRWCCTATCR
jgi:bifunctional N-acetylglucosamine-1-phosphate-uridyltransferase/glucosamine-1-phosphate-acetyltransferase GlmU-like protein